MKEDWENDSLWDLLGHARPVSVSPFFSRNILREIRQSTPHSLIPAFLLRWLGAGALAILTAGFFLNLHPESEDRAEFSEVFDTVAGLDTLIASGEVSMQSYMQDL